MNIGVIQVPGSDIHLLFLKHFFRHILSAQAGQVGGDIGGVIGISDSVAIHDLLFQLRFQRLKPSGIKILICAPAREFLVGPLSHIG